MQLTITYTLEQKLGKITPLDVPATLQRARALHHDGNLAGAKILYEEILKTQPKHSEVLNLLGLIAAQTGNPQLAADLLDKAIECDPRNVEAYCNKGTLFKQLDKLDAALLCYDEAIAIAPNLAAAFFNRGLVLQELKEFNAALASFKQAIAIEPDYVEAHIACVVSLQELKQWDAALASYDRAIAILPDYEDAHLGRGALLQQLGQLDAALSSYDRAIALKPDYAAAYVGRAVTSLLLGDFEKGWIDFEWRWKDSNGPSILEKRDFPQPLWLGEESIAGKRILLYSEQGLGDTLQFCRYAKLAADLGARVILEVQQPLSVLLEGLEGVSQLVIRGNPLPDFDFQCPLLSLPLAFKTQLGTVPSSAKYLTSDPTKVATWQTKLGEKTRPRIGLVWSGNPVHKNDQNRSVPLADLLRYLPPELQYVSLQKEVRENDKRTLRSNPQILQYSDDLHDFSDTAALCDCMDILISVDTSVAHLSGALGKNTWIMLPFVPDSRWLLDRTDSPWYPTCRIYRQEKPEDWDGVFKKVARDLVQRSSSAA